jgi:predicted dehydrogenase
VVCPCLSHPDIVLYGIASYDFETAQRTAKQYHFRRAYGSYEEMVADPAIDVMYVSAPYGQHFEWAFRAMQAGKHVLCEKPFTANAEEARRLVQLSKERNVVLEEAVSLFRLLSLFQYLFVLRAYHTNSLVHSATGSSIPQRTSFVIFSSRASMAEFCEPRLP